jgi:asparagine synthase (glutamine-hydrolysing)
VLNGAITDARRRWPHLLSPSRLPRTLPNDAWQPLLLAERGDLDGLARMCGHHASAVVDREHGGLVLARDAMGEKPLFVVREQGRIVAFASTTGCLRALGIRIDLGAETVAEFFTRGTTTSLDLHDPRWSLETTLAGVCRNQNGQPELRVPPRLEAPGSTLGEALLAATRRCSDAEGPIALALSGGLDSSAIAVALQQLGISLSAYQFCAAGEALAERQRAVLVAQHCGHRLRPVTAGPEVLNALPQLTADWGLPLGDPSVLAMHALAQAAVADGARVLLSGEGSDELLLGYARHRAAAWLPRRGWPWLPRRAWSMRKAARLWRALTATDPYAELLAVTPPGFRAEVLAHAYAVPPALPDVVAASKLARVRALDLDGYLRQDLLPKLDVATMAAAIEGRCPFLDAEVRAVAMHLDPAHALGKAPLRAWLAQRLPPAVLNAKKQGFALPLDRWFRGEIPWLDLLRDAKTRQRPHLRASGLDQAIDRHRRGAVDLGHGLYLVVAFEIYLRSQERSA